MKPNRNLIQRHRGAFGCLFLILGILVCSGGVSFAIDRICYSGLSQELPLYPNATITRRVHNMFNEMGMGTTVITMTTPDEPETVRTWYTDATRDYFAWQRNATTFHLAHGDLDISHLPDGGSQIILIGSCVG